MKKPILGGTVVYCDPVGHDHGALITAVWSDTCINVVFVSGDPNKGDTYGRQIERETSVTHASCPGQAHGRYWRFEDEPRNPVKAPDAV